MKHIPLALLLTLFAFGNVQAQEKTELEKVRTYQKECDAGNMSGCYNLVRNYEAGEGVTKDLKRASELYKKACDGGMMEGCNALGRNYDKGRGVTKDQKRAIELYEKSCDGGNKAGCFYLKSAEKLAKKRAQEKTYDTEKIKNERERQKHFERLRDYEKLCDKDEAWACYTVGIMYAPPSGSSPVGIDFERANQFFKKACDLNEYPGCVRLGHHYESGEGVTRNLPMAETLYQKACDGGDPWGCLNLGGFYEEGLGGKADLQKAQKFYQKSCDGGGGGCFALGRLYENGRGVKKDLVRAREFYQKACDHTDVDACKKAGVKMTPQRRGAIVINTEPPKKAGVKMTPQKRGAILFNTTTPCATCHKPSGSENAPSLRKRWGKEVKLEGGSTDVFNAEYIRRSIKEPSAQYAKGYGPHTGNMMPILPLNDEQIDDLIAFLKAQ